MPNKQVVIGTKIIELQMGLLMIKLTSFWLQDVHSVQLRLVLWVTKIIKVSE